MGNISIDLKLTRSEPAKSTKWNFETIVTQSPLSSSALVDRSAWCPRELAGRKPPRPIAVTKLLGVEGRPNRGEAIPLATGEPLYIEPGRANLEGERPPGGSGEEDRGGWPEPVYFFWVKVKEKMACERED